MKTKYITAPVSLKAVLAMVLLALGFSRAAANVDPVSSHSTREAKVTAPDVQLPCIFKQ